MGKRPIKIAFVDGGDKFIPCTRKVLDNEFDVISTTENPDLCIYCVNVMNGHRRFGCKKLEILGENSFPHFDEADYSISTHDISFGKRHCRIPFYAFNREYGILKDTVMAYDDSLYYKRGFCAALVGNSFCADPFRAEFMRRLHNRKKIDSAGKVFNTTGYTVKRNVDSSDSIYTDADKIAFFSLHRFGIAMENSSVEGYVTEKIIEAYAARTIPIYWGAPDIDDEFDSDSFIRIDRDDIDGSIERILEIDSDIDRYMSMLSSVKLLRRDYMEIYHDFLMNVIDGRTFEHNYGLIHQ